MLPNLEFLERFDASPRFSTVRPVDLSSLRTTSAVPDYRHTAILQSSPGAQDSKFGKVSANAVSVAASLFAATALAKIWTSRLAMHLDKATRDRLFRQLDILHDADEWVDDGSPVNLESYKSCVRAIIYHHINSRPSMALMPSGNVLALWKDGADKLSVEFLPGDKTRWMVQSTSAAGVERAAGTTPLERLKDVLQPYGADRWFSAS